MVLVWSPSDGFLLGLQDSSQVSVRNRAEDERLLLLASVRQQLDEGGRKQTPLLWFILDVAMLRTQTNNKHTC